MALRSALTRTGLARAVCSSGLGGFGQVAPAMGASRAGVAQPLAPSAAAAAFTTSAHRGRNLVETEVFDRSRQEIILGNRMPSVACDSWVAPNATLIGDTDIAGQCCVWHGSVLKGDLGAVRLGMFSNVMEKCVIDAAGSSTRIGQYTTIGAGTSISSAIVEDNVLVGARCILEAGCYVEENAALEAGTVVQAGQLIPSGQLWGGNPARYVRDLDGKEVIAIATISKNIYGVSQDHRDQHLPWGMAYLQTEALRHKLLAQTETLRNDAALHGKKQTDALAKEQEK